MDTADAIKFVQAYLYKHKQRLHIMTEDFIVSEVRRFVPEAEHLSETDLRMTVVVWRSLNGPYYSAPQVPPATPRENKIIDAVKNGVTTVIDGVDIKYKDGKVNIGVSGATAELKKGDTTLAAGVSWGGALGVETHTGDFHVTGELSSERWQLKLSYPQDSSIPDLSKLGKVFGEGETAMRKIFRETAGMKNLNDAKRVKDAVSPHLQPVKEAVEAAKAIATAPKQGGVSLGVSVGSPDPRPGDTGMPRGIQAQLTLTIRF